MHHQNSKIFTDAEFPFKLKFETNQTITCIQSHYQSGSIFIGTKYWLSVYYFTEEYELLPKRHYHIGSEINCISAISFNKIIYVFFGTNDGFIHNFAISDDNCDLIWHIRNNVYNDGASIIEPISKDMIVSVGDKNQLTFIAGFNQNEATSIMRKKFDNVLTSLKYYDGTIYVGDQNGDVHLLRNDNNKINTITTISFKSSILKILINENSHIVVTKNSICELNEDLKENTKLLSIPVEVEKVYLYEQNDEDENRDIFIIQSRTNNYIYSTDQEILEKINNFHITHGTFLGDFFIYLNENHYIYIQSIQTPKMS